MGHCSWGVASRPWQLYQLLLQAHQLEATDRLLFGSDFPRNSADRVIETMYSLNRFSQGSGLPSVPREKVRGIVERDALACLALKRSSDSGAGQAPPVKTSAYTVSPE